MISVILTARPSYSKLQPLITALVTQGGHVELVACASALLTRYGNVARQMHDDFPQLPLTRLYSTLEGAQGVTAAKDMAVLCMSLADHFDGVQPKCVVVMADRYETLAASIAASYQNIPVAHLQGGEQSGNIDDRVRDANTVLATYHFPATAQAATRVKAIAKPNAGIRCFGCPSIDVAHVAESDPPVTLDELGGHGARLDLHGPFVTVLQHADTEQPNESFRQLWETLEGVRAASLPALVFWPGSDTGMEGASKAIRVFMDRYPEYPMHTVRTVPPRRFLRLLTQTICLVGNSSAGIREGAYLGLKVVNVGPRQRLREVSPSVLHVDPQRDAITDAIEIQRRTGPPLRSMIYGDGHAAPSIAEQLLRWIR